MSGQVLGLPQACASALTFVRLFKPIFEMVSSHTHQVPLRPPQILCARISRNRPPRTTNLQGKQEVTGLRQRACENSVKPPLGLTSRVTNPLNSACNETIHLWPGSWSGRFQQAGTSQATPAVQGHHFARMGHRSSRAGVRARRGGCSSWPRGRRDPATSRFRESNSRR